MTGRTLALIAVSAVALVLGGCLVGATDEQIASSCQGAPTPQNCVLESKVLRENFNRQHAR